MKRVSKISNPSVLVSNSGKNLKPSGIREFFDIVYSMKDCVSLGVGEPDFSTSMDNIRTAMERIRIFPGTI